MPVAGAKVGTWPRLDRMEMPLGGIGAQGPFREGALEEVDSPPRNHIGRPRVLVARSIQAGKGPSMRGPGTSMAADFWDS